MTDKDKLEMAMKALTWIGNQNSSADSGSLQVHARNTLALINSVGSVRCRPPQDKNRWPPDMDQEAIEKAIDANCGCAGGWNCDCVSAFNQVIVAEWSRYNTRA